jgi:hypothetical protein
MATLGALHLMIAGIISCCHIVNESLGKDGESDSVGLIYGEWQLACTLCPLPLIKRLEGFHAGKCIAGHNSLVGPISLSAPASPGLANWLREQAVSFAFSTYRALRLLFLGVDAPPNLSLKLHERLFDRPMGLFVSGESTWMGAASFITGDVKAHELELGATSAIPTTPPSSCPDP